MKLDYRIFDPTGNITLLVETPMPAAMQPRIAAQLMALEPRAEQVGFLSPDGALRMAGGEFCGNAAMSAAVCAAEAAGQDRTVRSVRVSGAPAPVRVEAARQPDGSWQGVVEMPRPTRVTQRMLPGVGVVPVVELPGITHVVLTEPMPRPLAERMAREWCLALHADALGLMFFDRRRAALTPLVYVPEADTLFWETSCASGTTAVGAYLASEEGSVSAALDQPGGRLTITSDDAGRLHLAGAVRCIAQRTAEIEP